MPRLNVIDIEIWNEEFPIGTRVRFLKDDGEFVETTTRTEASLLSGHTPVVWLDDVRGCVALDHVVPIA